MVDTVKPPEPVGPAAVSKPGPARAEGREAKLAAALRANLRRRKETSRTDE